MSLADEFKTTSIDILQTADRWATSSVLATVGGSIYPFDRPGAYTDPFSLAHSPPENIVYIEKTTVTAVTNRLRIGTQVYEIQVVRNWGDDYLELYVAPIRE